MVFLRFLLNISPLKLMLIVGFLLFVSLFSGWIVSLFYFGIAKNLNKNISRRKHYLRISSVIFIIICTVFFNKTDAILKRYLNKYGFTNTNFFNEKIRRLNALIKANPKDAANYLSRGIAYANNLYYDRALPDFLTALHLNHNLPIANNYIGFININKGKYDEAEPYLKKAIEQSPNFSKPYFNLASIYKRRNKLDNAIEQITKAIECEPNFYEAYIVRAGIYYNKNEYDKAIADLEKAIKINPSLKQQLEYQIKIIQQRKSQNTKN